MGNDGGGDLWGWGWRRWWRGTIRPRSRPGSAANLHRYEVHPLGTFPHGPGPEFKTTVKVRFGGAGGWGGPGGGGRNRDSTPLFSPPHTPGAEFGVLPRPKPHPPYGTAIPGIPPRRLPLRHARPGRKRESLTQTGGPGGIGGGGPCTPALSPAPLSPPQATCTLRNPPEEPRQRGTATVVPVHPEDLLRVDRLVSITLRETPGWALGGGAGRGLGGLGEVWGGFLPPSPPPFAPAGLRQRLVPGAELPVGAVGPRRGDLHPRPPHHPQRLLPWGEELGGGGQ